MSSIVIDFEVLPEERSGDHTATHVCSELNRQLGDPASALRSGEFHHYAASASLSAPGSGILPSAEEREYPPSPPQPAGVDWNDDRHQSTSRRHHQDAFVGNRSNAEILEQISERERQLHQTAAGGHGERPHGRHTLESGALEEKCSHLQKRLDEVERQLRDAQESARIDRSRAQRFEQNLKDREQLLVHAKEMWLKESSRASKLADALTSAEDRLADQERRLQEVSTRFAEASAEVRQLRHLLDGPDGGGFGGGYSATIPSTDARSNGHMRLPPSGSPISPVGSSNLVCQPQSAVDRSFDEHVANIQVPSTRGVIGLQEGPVQQPHVPLTPARSWGVPETPARVLGVPETGVTNHLVPVQALPPHESETNADRFKHLCLASDAVLYEDDMIQIGLKTEYRGLEGQLAVYYGNKGAAAFQAFQVHYTVADEGALRLVHTSLVRHLEAHDQVVQRVTASCVRPFVDPPQMQVEFLLADACPRRIQLKFPVIITKFMQGIELRQDEFFHVWRSQRFVLNEVTSVVSLSFRLRTALVHIQRSLTFGGALRLHYGFDPSQENFVLVGQLADHGGDRENGVALIRVEVGTGRFDGKARVVVRASDHAISRAVCEAIVLQLAQPASSGFET